MRKKYNKETIKYRQHPKFNVPVIAHYTNKSIKYNSIIEAEELTGISYHNIFDACIGRTWRAGMVHWEFENGRHWIKYKAKQIVSQRENAMRIIGFNG